MGSHFIVFPSPIFKHHSGFGCRPELLPFQSLFPETGMKTLDIPILPWTARINVEGMDLDVSKPALQCCFYEFRSIVASDICRRSMSLYQPIKLSEHVCGSNTPSHMNQMTFPSVLIDYREHLQPTAPHSSVVNKVPAPHMAAMGCLGRKPRRQALSTPTRLAPGQAQTQFSANPLHLSLAYRPSIVFQ
jgi:hypothetical protein